MTLPFEIAAFGIKIPIHYPLELLGYFIGFQLYLYLRKKTNDDYGDENRLTVLMGAVLGAALGSKLLGFLEHPEIWNTATKAPFLFFSSKTILGGLVGGLIGVEISKKATGITRSSGDIYVFPLIFGIAIGRLGCFFQGVSDGTWGIETDFFLAMDGGDRKLRHPTPLYEIIILFMIAAIIKVLSGTKLHEGDKFKIFLGLYCAWRFFSEFIKPVVKYLPIQLSMIQMVSLAVCIYYCAHFILRKKQNGGS